MALRRVEQKRIEQASEAVAAVSLAEAESAMACLDFVTLADDHRERRGHLDAARRILSRGLDTLRKLSGEGPDRNALDDRLTRISERLKRLDA